MTQRDMPLKIAMRKHLWRTGYSTRVNVPMRAYTSTSASAQQQRFEEFTDLDVLGVAVGRDVRLERVIGDCKTSDRGSTERMFWVRGVADFFDADTAYLVREHDATAAAKQLAGRLGISIVTASDFALLDEYHALDPSLDWQSISTLLSAETLTKEEARLRSLDKKLNRLLDFIKYDYWVYEEFRNLIQVVAHLQEAARFLDYSNPVHLSLVIDCAWLFSVAVIGATARVRRAHLANLEGALREYIVGGQISLRERQIQQGALKKIVGVEKVDDVELFPPYFGMILELVNRFSRRPNTLNDILRYAELCRLSLVEKETFSLRDAFGSTYDPVAAKLLADVASGLTSAAALDTRFRASLRHLVMGVDAEKPTGGGEVGAEGARQPGGAHAADEVQQSAAHQTSLGLQSE